MEAAGVRDRPGPGDRGPEIPAADFSLTWRAGSQRGCPAGHWLSCVDASRGRPRALLRAGPPAPPSAHASCRSRWPWEALNRASPAGPWVLLEEEPLSLRGPGHACRVECDPGTWGASSHRGWAGGGGRAGAWSASVSGCPGRPPAFLPEGSSSVPAASPEEAPGHGLASPGGRGDFPLHEDWRSPGPQALRSPALPLGSFPVRPLRETDPGTAPFRSFVVGGLYSACCGQEGGPPHAQG